MADRQPHARSTLGVAGNACTEVAGILPTLSP